MHASGPTTDISRVLLETLFTNAPIGFLFVDTQFRFVRVNHALAQFNRLSPDAHRGRHIREVVPEIWPLAEPLLRRASRGEIVLNEEMVISPAAAQGAVFHQLISVYPIHHGGDLIGYGIVVEDITERKRAEKALSTRNDLYAMLAGTNRAVSRCASAEELFREVCRIAVEKGRFRFAWVGVPDGDLVRMAASAGDGGDLARSVIVSLDEADPRSHGTTGRAFSRGRSFVRNDLLDVPQPPEWRRMIEQSGIHASASFPFFERGRVAAVLTLYAHEVGFFTEDLCATLDELSPAVSFGLDAFLHEQARARDEEELRLRDRAMRAVSQGIVITDATVPGRPIIYVSPGFERLTGYSAAEVMGQSCAFLHGAETDPEAIDEIATAMERGRSCSVHLIDYRKDGTKFWNDLTLAPVTDAHGRVTHFVAVQTDVTERRRLEEQFRQAQKMEAVGRLAAGVAHDFNNLLTIINGYSDPSLTTMLPDDPLHEVLSEIHRAGERAETLTRQLLAFSRQQVLEPKVLSLNDVVLDTQKMLRRMIGEDVMMITTLCEDPWLIKADPGQLGQILINMAVNARDAMPTGGQLFIETRNVLLGCEGCARYPEVQPGEHVMLLVRDTGHGMDEATKERVFEPFFTTKGVGKGTGLGLATVHGIVQQSRGCIRIESEPGKGATFRVYLPRIAGMEAAPISGSRMQSMPPGTETVLVVEDQEAVRALAAHVLRSCGYAVLEASNGLAALEIARGHAGPIDLLVSDVVMPHLGGRDLATRLLAERPACKVLFLSGYTDDALIHHGVLEAEYAFLQKPFTPSLLARKVRKVLSEGSSKVMGGEA
ncbi:MAG: PAS domain S-box protein [Polyangiaceae bacterium]